MRKIFYIQQHLLLILFTIYIYQSQGCLKLGERKRNRERRKRKREEKEERIEERGREIPLHLQRKVALCTSREELHFALTESSLRDGVSM
jgi:hypothetical protein